MTPFDLFWYVSTCCVLVLVSLDFEISQHSTIRSKVSLNLLTSTPQFSCSKSNLYRKTTNLVSWCTKTVKITHLLNHHNQNNCFFQFSLIFNVGLSEFGRLERIALFSRLLPPRLFQFQSFSSSTSEQDLPSDPILNLFEVTWQATKPETQDLLQLWLKCVFPILKRRSKKNRRVTVMANLTAMANLTVMTTNQQLYDKW